MSSEVAVQKDKNSSGFSLLGVKDHPIKYSLSSIGII